MHPVLTRALIFLITALSMAGCHAIPSNTPQPASPIIPLNYLPALQGDYFRFDSSTLHRPFHIYVKLPPATSVAHEGALFQAEVCLKDIENIERQLRTWGVLEGEMRDLLDYIVEGTATQRYTRNLPSDVSDRS